MSTTLHRDSWDQYVNICEYEMAKLRNLAADLMELVDEMPIKHPQQETRRKILRGQCEALNVFQQQTSKHE